MFSIGPYGALNMLENLWLFPDYVLINSKNILPMHSKEMLVIFSQYLFRFYRNFYIANVYKGVREFVGEIAAVRSQSPPRTHPG